MIFLLISSTICAPGIVDSKQLSPADIRLKTFIKSLEYQQEQEAILNKSQIMLRLEEIAICFDLKPEWLLKVFLREANLNTKAINKLTKAVGIIQFMPKTARYLGTSTTELYNMSFIEQLDYVEKYLEKMGKGKKIRSYEDLYLLIFYPKALSKSDNFVIGRYNSTFFRQNKYMDINRDKKITVRDVKLFANKT